MCLCFIPIVVPVVQVWPKKAPSAATAVATGPAANVRPPHVVLPGRLAAIEVIVQRDAGNKVPPIIKEKLHAGHHPCGAVRRGLHPLPHTPAQPIIPMAEAVAFVGGAGGMAGGLVHVFLVMLSRADWQEHFHPSAPKKN